MPSFIKKLKNKLSKTHNAIASRVDDLLSYYKDIDKILFTQDNSLNCERLNF